MPLRPVVALVAIVNAYMLATVSRAEQQGAAPSVTVELLTPEVLVGEAPTILIAITAPSDRAMTVLRADYLHATSQLYGPDGKIIKHLEPTPAPSPLDGPPPPQILLPAGKSFSVPDCQLVYPDRSGRHRLHVSVAPTPGGPETERDFVLEVVPLDSDHVVQRIEVRVPYDERPAEILVAKWRDRLVLLYKDPMQYVLRLTEVAERTRINTRLEDRKGRDGLSEIVIQVEDDNAVRFLVVAGGSVTWPPAPAPYYSYTVPWPPRTTTHPAARARP